MSALTLGLPVIPTPYLGREEMLLSGGMVFLHPYRIALIQGGVPALIDWMVKHAEKRVDALADGRPVPGWPA